MRRVVYKEIVEGDILKIRAKSNKTQSGGGARDFRFRPHHKFEGIFRKLFPGRRLVKRRRGGVQTEVEVLVGQFYWTDEAGATQTREAIYEPPTDARGGEGRIPVVHTYPPLGVLPPANEGRLVLLLVQREDGVWPVYATEKSLRSGAWDPAVAGLIVASLDAERGHGLARGYVDLEDHGEYSDA